MQSEPLPESPAEPASESSLSPAGQYRRERERRHRELFFAAVAFIVVLILTSIQLHQFQSGDVLFVFMFNINFVLLIGISLVVLRNGIKLILERRRQVLGSRLRTRLVLSFVLLSLLPCLLMFLITTKYVQLSMDFWFKDQVENSMDAALELAGNVYEKVGMTAVAQAREIKTEILERGLAWGGQGMNTLMERKQREHRMALIGLYFPDGKQRAWHAGKESREVWKKAREEINLEQANSQGFVYTLIRGKENDFIFSLLAVDGGKNGYLVIAYDMGEGFKARIDRIVRGSGEYSKLRGIKTPLKHMLYSSLGVLTALIMLGAIWFGFRLARELSSPIFALAAGTDRISKGDLSVRLNDNSQDEFGMLIRSFNRMAQDLEQSRRETTEAYTMLEIRNQQIARHSKYIETVLNNVAAGVVSFDSNGYIGTVNRSACDILSMEPEELLGNRIEDFMPASYGKMAQEIRERFRQRSETRARRNISVPIGNEERRLLFNVVGFSTDDVYQGAVAVFEDISELERMQRMAAWREVARRIAHEIKNPLTPIKLSAQRIARKFGEQVNDPAFTQSTELIVKQVEHLQSMVQEFSAFAKLPEVVPQPGRLEPLLEAIAELFRNSHTNISWELHIPAPLPQLPMDKNALNRAFMNILTNAAEALLQSDNPSPAVSIRAICQPALNLVRIDFADNGPGLSEEGRSRIFEPYFSRKKGGTGLGLTIVRSIVTDHRGYVRAFSRESGGAVITMELPLA
ncbi:MAG: HAMP domain-containing protein [Desulfovibrio sp.]|jgi:two-component system nitrogen regulation sensor histidine kinase NtrY|nr:HAMP domain-containing protein [Desulfovibrio sp.]